MTSLMKPPQPSQSDALSILKAAIDAGANFLDAGEQYGSKDYNSLHLLNAYFTKHPEDISKVFISVKGCFDMSAAKPSNDEEGVQASINNCLRILDGKCWIDLFQASRGDPKVPVEETVAAIARFVESGKIGGVGLSECSAMTVRRAVKVHRIEAVEVELSLFETGVLTKGVAEACKELSIPIIAYSPLGRGFLTNQLRKFEDLGADDFRRVFPRFQPEVFDTNLMLVDEVAKIARRKSCTVPQIAIAWVTAQSKKLDVPVIPIPGTAQLSRLRENLHAVELTTAELQEIDNILERMEVKGGRCPDAFSKYMEL
ncbi:hypothetical protein LTR91_025244 [Friedmanniomyces endolithicus]|uniref:NADP-dependent oxidoreductase domain-containing protein n=1 Tax=Friedmanniomyces endolithicus TaxID=329885 RepID=A0AAN6H5F8_9PEZI|nr:hypothetical protein LTR91_025244 [Friedmanniomyces endolithicus]KAK0951849.1 hypothetical protein LTS01_025074 [Friedmanniomyces endolithicus]KAK1021615.1 hypothetical protein LTS16_026379 [Friedmanniomyces endolithicus]